MSSWKVGTEFVQLTGSIVNLIAPNSVWKVTISRESSANGRLSQPTIGLRMLPQVRPREVLQDSQGLETPRKIAQEQVAVVGRFIDPCVHLFSDNSAALLVDAQWDRHIAVNPGSVRYSWRLNWREEVFRKAASSVVGSGESLVVKHIEVMEDSSLFWL
jgi:hypothetical protein